MRCRCIAPQNKTLRGRFLITASLFTGIHPMIINMHHCHLNIPPICTFEIHILLVGWYARLSVETNRKQQDTNFPQIVWINCSIIWSNNLLLVVTTDFPLWESSYNKGHWIFYCTALHLGFTEDSIARHCIWVSLKILLHGIALEFHICLWRITQYHWLLPLFTGHQTDFLPHANAQKVCPGVLSR